MAWPEATFEAAVQAQSASTTREYLHNLAESRRVAGVGERAVADFAMTHLRVADDDDALAKAQVAVSAFVEQIATLEGTRVDEIPVLVVWNLNSIGNTQADERDGWKCRATAFANLLQSRPTSSVGVVIHRRSTSYGSRRAFHAHIASALEKAGIDVDMDLSLNFVRSHGNSRECLTLHGWLAICAGRMSKTWAGSTLLLGSIQGLSQPTQADMWKPQDPASVPYEAGSRASDVSVKQRSQALPANAYERLLTEALQGAEVQAKSKRGAPLACVAVLDNYNSNSALAILNVQKKLLAPGAQAAGCAAASSVDIRGIILPITAAGRAVAAHAVKEQAFKWWYNREIAIDGHARPAPQPWAGERPSAPRLAVGKLNDQGQFFVPDCVFKPFQEHDSTCMEATALQASLKTSFGKIDAPKWVVTQAAPGAGSGTIAGTGTGTGSVPPRMIPQDGVHPVPDRTPAPGGIASADQLKARHDSMAADTPTPNGKMHLYVTKEGACYAHVLSDVSVSRGERLLHMGSGARKDEADAVKCKECGQATFKIELSSDAEEVFFAERAMTLYAALAQLTLDGHRSVSVYYHLVKPAEIRGSAERYEVKPARSKFWAAKRSRTAPSEAGSRWDTSNIGALLCYDEVPNHYVKVT